MIFLPSRMAASSEEIFDNDYRNSGVMVGFIPNLRREKFQDQRVREALNYAFDFEELKRTIFYNQYDRIDSYFFGIRTRLQRPAAGPRAGNPE